MSNKGPHNYCLRCNKPILVSPDCSRWYQVFSNTIEGPIGLQGGRLRGYCHRVCPSKSDGDDDDNKVRH